MGVWLLWWALVAGSPDASAAAAPPDNPNAIVVTGERTKRSLKDTPSSVAVFSRRDIDRLAAPDRVQELLERVANVLIESRRDTPVIRGEVSAGVLGGLPAFLGGARPRTVLQVDGRTITFNEFANSSEGLWDVDHVEVFRSPQTTTQGVNSIGGAIFIQTADPTWRWEERARVIGGTLDRRQASAALSGPLVGDQLAVRFSGDVLRGRSSNRLSGPVAGVDLNDDHYTTGRAKLLAQPRAIPGLKLLLTYAHTHSQAPQGEPARRPFRKRRDDFCICGYFKVDVDSLTGAATYPISGAVESRTTVSWGKSRFQRFAVQGFGQTHIHGTDGSLESLLEWKPAGRLTAIGGVSWLAMDLHQFIDLTATPFGTGTFEDRQRSSALFGEATWRAAGRLSLTAGMRYQSDSKRRVGVLHTTPDQPLDYDKTVKAFLPKLSAAYDLSRELRVGAIVQRAYNPGGVTMDPGNFKIVRFGPEYLWDYEGFVRGDFFGHALNLTANLFYNDIRNAQRTLDTCFETPTGCVGLSEVANAPRAHSYGAELETSYVATRALTLRAAAGLLRTRITKTLLPKDALLGKEFAGAPHFTGMAAADWNPVPRLQVSAQVRHTSKYFGDDADTADMRINSSTTVDARASWQAGRLTLFAYAQNLFDTFHISGWTDVRSNPDVEIFSNDARELGLGVEARF